MTGDTMPEGWVHRAFDDIPNDWQVLCNAGVVEKWEILGDVASGVHVICSPKPKPPVIVTLDRESAEAFVGERAYTHEAVGRVRKAVEKALRR